MKNNIVKAIEILAFMLILSAPFYAFAADDFYYFDDFSAYNEGSVPGGLWTFDNTGGGEHKIVIKDEKNMLKMSMPKDAQGSVNALFTLPQAVYDEVVILKTRVYLSQKNRFFSSAYILGENSRLVISSAFHKDGTFKTYTNSTWQSLTSYNSGEYYDIEYVMDFVSKRFDIYVNGILYENITFRNTAALSNNIKSVKFYIEQENCEVFIDYIKIYTRKVKEIGIIKDDESMKITCCSSDTPTEFDKIYIDFYKSMDKDSLNEKTVYIKRKSDNLKQDYVFLYAATEKRYIMELSSPLKGGEMYEIYLRGGEGGVLDSVGGKISGCDYVHRFSTLPFSLSVSQAKINDGAAVGQFSAITEIENLSGIRHTAKVITVVYKGNILIDIDINDVSIDAFENITQESKFFNINESEYTAKTFIWNSMSPYTETVNLIGEE